MMALVSNFTTVQATVYFTIFTKFFPGRLVYKNFPGGIFFEKILLGGCFQILPGDCFQTLPGGYFPFVNLDKLTK